MLLFILGKPLSKSINTTDAINKCEYILKELSHSYHFLLQNNFFIVAEVLSLGYNAVFSITKYDKYFPSHFNGDVYVLYHTNRLFKFFSSSGRRIRASCTSEMLRSSAVIVSASSSGLAVRMSQR